MAANQRCLKDQVDVDEERFSTGQGDAITGICGGSRKRAVEDSPDWSRAE